MSEEQSAENPPHSGEQITVEEEEHQEQDEEEELEGEEEEEGEHLEEGEEQEENQQLDEEEEEQDETELEAEAAEEAARLQAEEEEAARQLEEQLEAARVKAEEGAARRRAKQEAEAQKQAEEEEAKLAAEAEAAAQRAEAAQKKKSFWDELKEKLPTNRSDEMKAKRKELFQQFDPNGNGYLSLAEVDASCRKILGLDQLTDDLPPILMRAFTAAKDSRKAKGKNKKHGDDYVERAEFRRLFVFIKQYFELWFMFDEIDSGDDRRINKEEFCRCIPKIESWGVSIPDADAAFSEIDTNGGGIILFQEFSDWTISKGLDLEEEDSDDDDDEDKAKPPPQAEQQKEEPPSARSVADKAAAGERKKPAPAGKKAAPKKSFSKKSFAKKKPEEPKKVEESVAKPTEVCADDKKGEIPAESEMVAAEPTKQQEEEPQKPVAAKPPNAKKVPKVAPKPSAKKSSCSLSLSSDAAPPAPAAPSAKKNLDEYSETLSAPGITTVDELFKSLDMNGNGMLSLAELDKAVVQLWPKFNSKPALMRAYKACDKNGTGFVSKKEFELFLDYIVIYHNTWVNFAKIDTSGDRRLTEEEFITGAVSIGIEGETNDSLKKLFDEMDKNDGGIVLFDEFCAAFAEKQTAHHRVPPEQIAAPEVPQPPRQPKTARVESSVERAKTDKRFNGTGTNSSGMSGARSARTKPIVDTPLAAPRHKPAPPPTTPPEEVLKRNVPPTKKVRLVGDPVIEALEAKVRERKAAERLRQEQMHRRAQQLQEEFERREQERQEERQRRLEEERRAKEEDFQRRHQERIEAEAARQARLAGRLKVDMDVIQGNKSIADKLKERADELKKEEDDKRKVALSERKQVCAMGPNFYNALKEHEEKTKARAELEAKERQNRRVEVSAVPPLPVEYQTKVRQNILAQDEQKRVEVVNHRQISHEQRAKRLAYAQEVKEKHVPKHTETFVPPEDDVYNRKTAPRETRDTRARGNAAIRGHDDYPTSPTHK